MKNLKKKALVFSTSFALLIGAVSVTNISCGGATGTSLSLQDKSIVMEITPEHINQFIKRYFPVEKPAMVGKVILEDAKVQSIIGGDSQQKTTNDNLKDKLLMGVSAKWDPPMFPAVSGGVDILGGITYNKEKKAIYLKDPIVEKVRFGDTTISIPDWLKPFVSKFAAQYLGQIPIYQFKSNFATYILKDIRVQNGKIVVKFGL